MLTRLTLGSKLVHTHGLGQKQTKKVSKVLKLHN